jgi:hypothetical protein
MEVAHAHVVENNFGSDRTGDDTTGGFFIYPQRFGFSGRGFLFGGCFISGEKAEGLMKRRESVDILL